MPKVIPLPAIKSRAAEAVNRRPAQVAQMTGSIAKNYVPLIPPVEEHIVRMWRRGVTIAHIAAMYGGRGIGVAQVEAIIWLATHSNDRRAA